jgi:hypothetical protein
MDVIPTLYDRAQMKRLKIEFLEAGFSFPPIDQKEGARPVATLLLTLQVRSCISSTRSGK